MPRLLASILLALYPAALRRDFRDDLAASLERAWRDECTARPWIGPPIALLRALADAARAHAAARGGPQPGPPYEGAGGPQPGPPYEILGDVRYALRAFGRAPGFFAGVLLTLALGIGANAAVFSLVKAVMLQPLPYERPDDLVMLWRSFVVSREFWRLPTTPRFVTAWREQAADLVTIAAVKGYGSLEAEMDLVADTGADRLRGAFATPNFFDVLGARPALGRVFSPADDAAGQHEVVVLGHSAWVRAFAADPAIVGRTITLTTGRGRTRAPRNYTVLGVLGPAFRFNYPDEVHVWAPRSWDLIAAESPDAIGYQVVGRLRPGVSFEMAGTRLAALHETIRPVPASIPMELRQTTTLERVHDWVAADTAPMLALLSGVALVLLVIACATTANALFIRVSERRRELAMRTALGASRRRLLRQLLIEGAVLAVAGTAAGLLLAALLFPFLRVLVPATVPRGDEIALDATVLWFAAAVAALVTMLAGLAPAWRGSRFEIAGGLKQNAASVSADRLTTLWRRGLVAIQAGLAALLLVAASLLLLSFWRMTHVPLGFDARGVLTVEMRDINARATDTEAGQAARLRLLQDDLVARVAAIPGVSAVAISSAVPFRGVDWRRDFEPSPEHHVGANERQVDPAYFTIMNIPLRRGRLLSPDDGPGTTPVAVVSESFVRAAFGDADPIGRVLAGSRPVTIVGVVGDVRYASFRFDPSPAVYLPRAQRPSELMCLLVQTRGAGLELGPAIRAAIRGVDPTLPAMKLATIDGILDDSLADRRFYTVATTTFAILALVLAVAGLIVIVMRTIVERRKELAIRTALGATRARLEAAVTWQGLVPVAAGVVVGLGIAFAGASALGSFLFGVEPRAVGAYAAAAGILLTTAIFAGWGAARWSAGAPPASVLRADS